MFSAGKTCKKNQNMFNREKVHVYIKMYRLKNVQVYILFHRNIAIFYNYIIIGGQFFIRNSNSNCHFDQMV